MWFGLPAAGNFYDTYRYAKSGVMPEPGQALWHSISQAPEALVDRSFLKGMSDLLDSIHRASEHPIVRQIPSPRTSPQKKPWRRLNGSELLAKVVRGVKFVDGEEQNEQAA
jgi:hypothetical protein